jgi:hypothetical protein
MMARSAFGVRRLAFGIRRGISRIGAGKRLEPLKTGAGESMQKRAIGAPSPARIATRSVAGVVFALPITDYCLLRATFHLSLFTFHRPSPHASQATVID